MSDLAWITVIAMLSITTLRVVSSIQDIKETERKERLVMCERVGYQPPVIPQCERPLWDRIREGCDDGHD
jgi:hypothetical protein